MQHDTLSRLSRPWPESKEHNLCYIFHEPAEKVIPAAHRPVMQSHTPMQYRQVIVCGAAAACRVQKTEGSTASKGGSLLRAWGDKDPLKRPSCALLVTLVQSVLRQADTVTVTAVVTSRYLSFPH